MLEGNVNVASERYQLKHFYYGQFVKDGAPVGDLRLLAQTSGISKAAIAETLQIAVIPPMKAQSAWSVIRGKQNVPFVLAKATVGSAGQTVLHFVILPSELLRSLGGNLRLFQPILDAPPPAYSRVGNPLKPLVLSDVQPPAEEQEVDDMLDLMMYTRNRTTVMETLLGAVVKGVPVVIVNAPPAPNERLTFITGLLSLLPPSVRFAVTFATHTLPSTKTNVQVRFLAHEDGDNIPSSAVIFDWDGAALSGGAVQEPYSHFIVSQLRLDAELVIRQTRQLTNVASWRVKRGDRLADALAYASQRMSLDDAVRNNQPVEAAEVAKVLADDPTLSDEMRLAYARHLLSFSVALGELDHAEPLGMLLSSNDDLAAATYDSLTAAIQQGAAGDVYDLLERWLANPLGPQGQRWVDLAHQAALTYYKDMVDANDTAEMMLFLKDVDEAGVAIGAEQLMPQLIQASKPAAATNSQLAHRLLTYAVRQLPAGDLEALLLDHQFTARLPEAIRRYAQALQNPDLVRQPRLLLSAAKVVKPSRRLALVRLTDLALRHNQIAMINETVLKQLARAALEDWSAPYRDVLLRVVQVYDDDELLMQTSAAGRRQLLSILLSVRAYRELAREMIRHSRLLYPGEKQTAYAKMLQLMFAETPIPEAHAAEALEALAKNGIRSLPLAMTFIGVLEGHQKPSELTDAVAGDVTDQVEAEPGMLSVLPIEAMRTLLAYHIRRQNAPETLRVARLFPLVAARYGARTAKLLARAYNRLDWEQAVDEARTEMLRRYIRAIARDEARAAVDTLGETLGNEVKAQLEATYTVKLLMNDADLDTYAETLHHVAEFLHDTAAAYQNGRNVPTQKVLLGDLDSLPGGLQPANKKAIANDIVEAGRALCTLGDAHKRVRGGGSDRRTTSLLQAEADPQSAVEVLRVMSGYLADGERHPLKFAEQPHPHPLPRRSAQTLMEQTSLSCSLLTSMTTVNGSVKAHAVRNEIHGMWQDLPANRQQELLPNLARDLQRTADLIPLIAEQGSLRALEDTGLGRRLEANQVKPSNTLEFYRFVAGYYLMRL